MPPLKTKIAGVLDGLRRYHFEFRHLTILFIVLIVFQLAVSFVHRNSVQKFLTETQAWYQQDSAERLANLTSTSLELLLESKVQRGKLDESEARKVIQGFNIIFSQQLLHQNVQEVCLLVGREDSLVAIDDGGTLYAYLFAHTRVTSSSQATHARAVAMYAGLRSQMQNTEQIRTIVEGAETFHTFVPFVPRGEYVGALYMKNTPDFAFITRDLISSYGQTTATYLALIFFGLIATYYISSYTLRERNEAQAMLFEQQKKHLAEQINYQNELLFTKRIYHTHHKAEKIMGFIKEDLRNLTAANTDEVRRRITKYSNFIARVIYDMKWYDPPVQTIRGPLFRTDLNDVLRFLVDNVFLRVAKNGGGCIFDLSLDDRLPPVPVNEFVVWEAFEPIIQNCVEHAGVAEIRVSIRTRFDPAQQHILVTIADNGKGIAPFLLEPDDQGLRQVFKEHTSTKSAGGEHAGYGCYIAHEIATQRCGWTLDAENGEGGGCRFTFLIPQQS
jgi:anti-sigma regulatory factor (Ser/Thr protein kinase)